MEYSFLQVDTNKEITIMVFPVSLELPPRTQSVKYAGSKLKLLPYILNMCKGVNISTVFDGFSGSTRVSQALAKSGYSVHSNDASILSEILGYCYLMNTKTMLDYNELIQHLNNVKPVDGWFTENYGGAFNNGCSIQEDGLKKIWQKKNTQKLDAIREEIDTLNLSKLDKSVALTSLILGLDQVDSTLGHFVSYLKDWSPRSSNELVLKVPYFETFDKANKVTQQDIFDLLPHVTADLAYLDPPYGSNNEKMPPSRVRYASYYHIWTTICLNDKPELFGKAKRRIDSSDTQAASIFEEYKKTKEGRFIALEAIDKLLKTVPTRYIILSYSSGGRATSKDLLEIIEGSGTLLKVDIINHKKNVMANMKWTNDWTRELEHENKEFLFLVEKNIR